MRLKEEEDGLLTSLTLFRKVSPISQAGPSSTTSRHGRLGAYRSASSPTARFLSCTSSKWKLEHGASKKAERRGSSSDR